MVSRYEEEPEVPEERPGAMEEESLQPSNQGGLFGFVKSGAQKVGQLADKLQVKKLMDKEVLT